MGAGFHQWHVNPNQSFEFIRAYSRMNSWWLFVLFVLDLLIPAMSGPLNNGGKLMR
jgi:hypothetical protein